MSNYRSPDSSLISNRVRAVEDLLRKVPPEWKSYDDGALMETAVMIETTWKVRQELETAISKIMRKKE